MKRIIFLFKVLFLAGGTFAANGDLPQTLAELNHWYIEPPVGSNAATFFLQGIAALKITRADWGSTNLPLVGDGTLPPLGSSIPRGEKIVIDKFVRRNQSALPFFEQGAEREQSRYPIDLTQGENTKLSHLAGIKQAEQFLQLAAISQAEAGQGREAGESVLISFGLARSLEAEPVLISQLVRMACITLARSTLEQTVNRVALPPEMLDRLQESLKQIEQHQVIGVGYTRWLVGERINGLSLFDLSREKLSEVLLFDEESVKKFADESEAKLKADRLFYAESFDQALVEQTRNPAQFLKASKNFPTRSEEADKRGFVVSSYFLSTLAKAIFLEARCLANLRLAHSAIALERFRAAHDGLYPEYLSELSDYLPVVPQDPFSPGVSLKYHKKGDGYLLYSIGSDLKHDSGNRKSDVVFEVVNPPKLSRP